MLNVKEAAARAMEHAREVFDDQNIADLLLEEVDFESGAPPTWKVTVSFVRPEELKNILRIVKFMRTFKIVHLDAETGEMLRITHRSTGLAA